MPSFDFISDASFRQSLESDHAEMVTCVENGAWKCAQVAAGSIIEALLVDYLQAHPHPSRSAKIDPLKIQLSEAITVCAAEGILSARTADLCSVIRSFRNLIHAGRVVRLDEPPPDKNSATIALQLVELITKEMARALQKLVGLTAEQVVAKILKDPGSVKLLRHLLEGFLEKQREKLLISLLPAAYQLEPASDSIDINEDDRAERIEQAYRVIFDGAAEPTKQACLAQFVRILKEEDGSTIARTTGAFFRSRDLEFVSAADRPIVIEHVLGFIPSMHFGLTSLRVSYGLQLYLSAQQLNRWLDPLIRTVASNNRTILISSARHHVHQAISVADPVRTAAIKIRINFHIKRAAGDEAKVAALEALRDDEIPF